MFMEETLIILKPDCMEKRIAGEVIGTGRAPVERGAVVECPLQNTDEPFRRARQADDELSRPIDSVVVGGVRSVVVSIVGALVGASLDR